MDIVSDAVLDQLNRTKGWTRFFSVMMWIAVVFLALGGVAVIVGMTVAGGSMGELSGLGAGAGMGVLMGGIYLLMAFLYAYPALKCWKFSDRVVALLQDPTEMNLVAALVEQRRFWKFVGICVIIYLSLIVVIFLFSIVAGIIGASGGV